MKQELEKLDLGKMGEIAFFSWAKLNSLNDGHILSAAYSIGVNKSRLLCSEFDGENNANNTELFIFIQVV